MRIFLLADYWVGLEVTKFLISNNENIVGVGIHPPTIQKNTQEILDLLKLPKNQIFEGANLNSPETVARIRELKPDIILSVFWGTILKQPIIDIPSKGCINFHLSYLPYNRGKNPNVWPIIEGTPAGVTLHYIDAGVDTGDIVSQAEVKVTASETAGTLYRKLEAAIFELFKQTWPLLKSGKNKRVKQNEQLKTFHFAKDFKKLDEIDLNRSYTGREFIDLLRAKTFPPHPGPYFIQDGQKVSLSVKFEVEN